MKKLLAAMFVALLMVGCGDEQQQAVNDPSIPAAIPCTACEKPVSKMTDKCPQCGHPTAASIKAYRIQLQGGPEVLAKIKEAKESGATRLHLAANEITDVSPLEGLTNLEWLNLGYNQITDISSLKGLTNLEELGLWDNEITDVSPLAGLTNLEELALHGNQITDVSPLAGLTKLHTLILWDNPIPEDQKSMLKKALPKCDISFEL